MGVNSADHQDDGCGNALLWIIGVVVAILIVAFAIPVVIGFFALLWSAIQVVLGVLAFLAIICVVGLLIRYALFFLWFIINISI